MAWKQTLRELWQKEKWYWLAAVVLGVLLSLLFAAHWTEGYADMIQKGIGGKVVRFHVLANSDSEEDQTLKLAVRDRVLQEYGDLLEACTSKEETLAALKNAQQEISETAEAEVLAQGYAYPVRVSLVREEFPFKKYGDLIFPAGVYDALSSGSFLSQQPVKKKGTANASKTNFLYILFLSLPAKQEQ
jgi:stage II sporulation protein R